MDFTSSALIHYKDVTWTKCIQLWQSKQFWSNTTNQKNVIEHSRNWSLSKVQEIRKQCWPFSPLIGINLNKFYKTIFYFLQIKSCSTNFKQEKNQLNLFNLKFLEKEIGQLFWLDHFNDSKCCFVVCLFCYKKMTLMIYVLLRKERFIIYGSLNLLDYKPIES